jgi:flavin reductase (DIM6/NTAB) family NADH-FMN oxidoreductase RutF
MVVFALDKKHYSEELLRSTKTFVVNVLGQGQEKLAGHFARQAMAGEDKLDATPTREANGGARILTEAIAWLDCEVEAIHPVGDHLLVVGRVHDGAVQSEGLGLSSASGIRYRTAKV